MSGEAETIPQPQALGSIIDPYQFLHIRLNPDGTITRIANAFPTTSATNVSVTVVSEDIPINKAKNTWARIFIPKQAFDRKSSNKLPLVLYFHGGGFILGSPDLTMFHEFCSEIAHDLPVILVSPSYRLAPEHRLPAVYDDAMEALRWIKTIHELKDYADYSNCFLMGSSAGGNIAYHVGLRAAAAAQETDDDNLYPLKIKGLILHQPFFGGVKRNESELRLMSDPFFPPCVSDLMWELSLPVGVDRDHKYCNPMVDEESCFADLEKIKRIGWRVLISGCDGDQLIDRQIELAKMMEKKGINVVGRFGVGDFHGFEIVDSSKAMPLRVVLQNFIFSTI